VKPFTVPGLLRAAASYIEIHGHEQRAGFAGGMLRASGSCCPLAAFYRLSPGCSNMDSYQLRVDAAEAVGEHLGRPGIGGLGPWSDRTPTAEVLATVRRVARELDGQR
jgi:hypothetical protein